MRRRNFIALLGGAAAAWPLAARAQPATPVIGFLSARSPAESASALQAFRHGLGQSGYFEGKNVTIDYRWAEGRYDRLPALAAELIRRQVAVIAATGGEPSPLAAKAATAAIPIVFTIGSDPVDLGLVASLNKPGGNVTGVTFIFAETGSKRLELVRQLLPNATTIALLVNPSFPPSAAGTRDVQAAARTLGVQINVLNASIESQIDTTFATISQQRADALIVGTDPFLLGQRSQLVQLAGRHAIPTLYFSREFVDDGGPDELRREYRQRISTGWRLHGPNSQWRKPGHVADRAANTIPTPPQPQERKGAGPRNSSALARARRRGARMRGREFITLLGRAAIAWPLAARAAVSA
jgi:putative tryptophan/tyrosine transport system substrate-binding protein